MPIKDNPRILTQKGEGVRVKLLDAAEQIFLNKGFKAATQREIAAAADLEQGLLTYYFKTKKDLFEKALERRLGAVFALQRDSLKKLQKAKASSVIDIEDILQCYCDPIFEAIAAGDRGVLFVIHFTHAHMPPDSAQDLQTAALRYYSPLRKAYINALRGALPNIAPQQVELGFDAFESIYFSLLADRRGSTNIPFLHSHLDLREHLIRFSAAGFRGPQL